MNPTALIKPGQVMLALTDVAIAVGNLQTALGERAGASKPLVDAVLDFTRNEMALILQPVIEPAKPAPAPEKRKGGRPKKSGAWQRAAEPVKQAELPKPAKPPAARTTTPAAPLCAMCSQPFERTGPRQKFCKPCAAKRDAENKNAYAYRKREKAEDAETQKHNPAATPDRLARIKAADQRLDTIPD